MQKFKEQFRVKTEQDWNTSSQEFFYVAWFIINEAPSYYFDTNVYRETLTELDKVISTDSDKLNINSEILEHFYIAFDTYKQVTETINDLSDISMNHQLKNRLYRLPTYISIVEGCLTNLYRTIILILDQYTDKDYSVQKKLKPLCEALNKNNFEHLTADVDIDIRNSINHGAVLTTEEGKSIGFRYTSGKSVQMKNLYYYQFDNLIDSVYDTCSGILLGLSEFLLKHTDSLDQNSILSNQYVAFNYWGLKLSLPDISCLGINDNSIEKKQLNINFKVSDTDRTFLIQTALEITVQIHDIYPDYERYFINFENDRLLLSWVRFKKSEIISILNDYTNMAKCIEAIIKRGDIQIANPSDEDVNMSQIKYYKYPNYQKEQFHVKEIEDVSLEGRKRLKARLYIGNIEEKQELLKIINESINWIKTIKNPPSSKTKIKHGTMDADSIYLNVYKDDKRKDKNLLHSNENLVCMVDYNIDGRTNIKYGGILQKQWNLFFYEKNGLLDIAWRERKYVIGNKELKVGRNDLCPCNSGEKFKKCHGK
ncbi:YecA family protein [Viridibacillus sp. NPDC093762]|uniref:YecA family protein n=1 Tax=Viridibacillus sp. NPDC093762 TaxID=3390720 RepID=UPI003CFE6D5C